MMAKCDHKRVEPQASSRSSNSISNSTQAQTLLRFQPQLADLLRSEAKMIFIKLADGQCEAWRDSHFDFHSHSHWDADVLLHLYLLLLLLQLVDVFVFPVRVSRLKITRGGRSLGPLGLCKFITQTRDPIPCRELVLTVSQKHKKTGGIYLTFFIPPNHAVEGYYQL